MNDDYVDPPEHPRFQQDHCVCGHPLHDTVDGLKCLNCAAGGIE